MGQCRTALVSNTSFVASRAQPREKIAFAIWQKRPRSAGFRDIRRPYPCHQQVGKYAEDVFNVPVPKREQSLTESCRRKAIITVGRIGVMGNEILPSFLFTLASLPPNNYMARAEIPENAPEIDCETSPRASQGA